MVFCRRRSGFFGFDWDYWYYTGTSVASPHVAGVAALVKSLHPEYGPDEIRQVLRIQRKIWEIRDGMNVMAMALLMPMQPFLTKPSKAPKESPYLSLIIVLNFLVPSVHHETVWCTEGV